MISQKDIDVAFRATVIAELADLIKLPAEADRLRFKENVHTAVRSYLFERARTDWHTIGEQIRKLYGLTAKAEGDSTAALLLTQRIDSMDTGTRNWLERCMPFERRPLTFPPSDEILSRNYRTRERALVQIRLILSYGLEPGVGRKRATGKRSRSKKPLLRTPQGVSRRRPDAVAREFRELIQQLALTYLEATGRHPPRHIGPGSKEHDSRGRPRDVAARELIQQLALTYLEATGRHPPRHIGPDSKGPFARFVRRCFELMKIATGNVIDLINERESTRLAIDTAREEREAARKLLDEALENGRQLLPALEKRRDELLAEFGHVSPPPHDGS